MQLLSSLTRRQKESIALLQIGTFLEYFDLMLYVHMAVLLNELFFPKTDPQTAALLSALAFSSTYFLRPVGALIFGWIGDNVGRKATVILTTLLMSISCMIMANIPTYAQVGITAAWLVTLCRVIQGLSSMGEIVGAEIYLTETIKEPSRYPAVGLITCSATVGSLFALFIASLAISACFNWRAAFWIGACIAVVGSIARTRLRETPEFINAKSRLKDSENRNNSLGGQKSFNVKTILACFLIQSGYPVSFFLTYIYCGDILKNSFGYSPENVIHNNLMVALVELIGYLVCVYVCCKVHPLKILRTKVFIALPFFLALPIGLQVIDSPNILFCFQLICILLSLTDFPATAVYYKYFPTLKRFTYTVFIFASSRAVMYTMTSFLLVYLTNKLGHMGLWLILLPVIYGFSWGIRYFEKLEFADQCANSIDKQKIAA